MRQSHKTGSAPEHVTAGAGSASLAASLPWCSWPPRRASRVRASCWARALSSPRYTAALVDAPLRSVCQSSPCCGKPYRTAPPTRPTPSLRPRSLPSSRLPEVCLETMEFDVRRRHGTTTTHAPHSSPKVAWEHDEHALAGRAFLALAPSRVAAHLVITRKEIRCTRCHSQNKETVKFVDPTRNKILGSRSMKTCRRRAGGNFHLTAAPDRVGILTVLAAKMPCSGRRCCLRKNVSSQVMRSSASTLAWRSARPRSCASTPSRSRFNAAVGDATDSASDCEVGTREPAQEDAAAMARDCVEDWAESEQKGLLRYATTVPMFFLLCQCVRVRARARVLSSGLSLFQKFEKFKQNAFQKSWQGF